MSINTEQHRHCPDCGLVTCICFDENEDDDFDEAQHALDYERCPCRLCYCMDEVPSGWGPCDNCLVGAHQG